MTLYLSDEQVREVLLMQDLIPVMEKALIDFSAGRVVQPLRTSFEVKPHGGFIFIMPAYGDGLGAKIVTLYFGNQERGLPAHFATVFLLDPETGVPLAVMDGTFITEMRTAAVSAAATKLLAPDDAQVLAIIGCGVQARSHYEAMSLIRDFEEVRVCDREPEAAIRFAEEIGGRATSAEGAVRGADVVVTVTSATEPVLEGAWLKQGCHVNAVGAPRANWRELDDDVMSNVIFVDSREAAMAESGDVILSGAEIYAEIGEALVGEVDPRRDETTVFKSLGMAIEDVAAAMLVYRKVVGE